jgi:hypothetical protein
MTGSQAETMPEKYAEELYLSKIYGWSKLET